MRIYITESWYQYIWIIFWTILFYVRLMNMIISCFWQWKKNRDLTKIFNISLSFIGFFSLETCLFQSFTEPRSLFVYPGTLQQPKCARGPSYQSIISYLRASWGAKSAEARQAKKEKWTWHTPYKASSVRSCLNSGIIRILQLWRDFLFSSFTVIEGWCSLPSVFHFTIRYIWLQWCLHYAYVTELFQWTCIYDPLIPRQAVYAVILPHSFKPRCCT